jgi:transketolase N-terminal domain/subunit
MPTEPIADKWESFGWHGMVVDDIVKAARNALAMKKR